MSSADGKVSLAKPRPAGLERVVVDRVAKTFGATAALRDVSCELRAGELTLIEGPNGSGKTTLLRILGAVLRPTSGTVAYQPLGQDVAAVRGEVGWLSHDSLAYGDLSGRVNIQLAAELHGLDPRNAWERSRERFELARFANRPMRTNSRGQQQRIALARALVHQPSLLLLDEPTTGLDRASVARVLKLIDEELSAGAIVAVVSHDSDLFRGKVGARLALERGTIV